MADRKTIAVHDIIDIYQTINRIVKLDLSINQFHKYQNRVHTELSILFNQIIDISIDLGWDDITERMAMQIYYKIFGATVRAMSVQSVDSVVDDFNIILNKKAKAEIISMANMKIMLGSSMKKFNAIKEIQMSFKELMEFINNS